MAVVIYGSEATGWRQVFDYSAGVDTTGRVRVMMGPAKTIDTAMAALQAAVTVIALDPSASPGSAVATIRCTYSTVASDAGGAAVETRNPLVQITPLMETVDLRAHAKTKSIGRYIPTIEQFIAAGDMAGLKTYVNALGGTLTTSAKYFAALWVAGVTHFEAAAISITITKYYNKVPATVANYTDLNKVVAFPGPDGVDEPKYVDLAGTVKSFEWRLVSVSPTIQRGGESIVTWTYIGREHWAKELYSGGTWEPEALW